MMTTIVVPGLAAPPMFLKPGSGGTKPGGRKPQRQGRIGERKKSRFTRISKRAAAANKRYYARNPKKRP